MDCNIFLIPSGGLLPIIDQAEALDREALQIAGAIHLWVENSPSPQCVGCSTRFDTKQVGGWVVVIPASFEPTAVVGVCSQCIGQPDLLWRALAFLEAETGIVVEPSYAGRA